MLCPETNGKYVLFFFFNDTATTEIYTLSLHDALPILSPRLVGHAVIGGSARGAEHRDLGDAAIGCEHLETVAQLLEGRVGDLQLPHRRVVFEELERGGDELGLQAPRIPRHPQPLEEGVDLLVGFGVLELVPTLRTHISSIHPGHQASAWRTILASTR